MTSGPPPYPPGPQGPRGPYPGQPWAPHPPGPGFGPPPPPPPPPLKKGNSLVWAVLGVVVLLVAAGVTTYLLAFHDSGDGSGRGGGAGGDGAQGGCSGDYCVGKFPYANACGAFPPSEVAARLGDAGGEGLLVQETYADPLPPSQGERPPTWTYGLRSRCDISALDIDGATFRSLTVELQQSGRGQAEAPTAGTPLPGFDRARVVPTEGRATVTWARGNVQVRFDVTWTNRKPAIPDGTLATAAKAIDEALATPVGAPSDLGDQSTNGGRVVDDACEVFTGADFEAATKYTASPLTVRRTYRTGTGPRETSCARTTAPANSGIPTAEGTTVLDGALAPTVRVQELADPAAAASRLDEERKRFADSASVPGTGDGAFFGRRDGSSFTLQFTSGVHLVSIDCGLSNGNSDWTPAEMRDRLEPLAKAVAGRMP